MINIINWDKDIKNNGWSWTIWTESISYQSNEKRCDDLLTVEIKNRKH